MRRAALSAILLCAALLCAACTTAPTPPPTPAATDATAAATTTTASPGELAPRRVKAATLPSDALAAMGAKEVAPEVPWTRWGLPTPCVTPRPDSRDEFGYYINHNRSWEGSDYVVHHLVTWFKKGDGTTALTRIRTHAESCRQYVEPELSGSDQPITVTAFDLAPEPGTDAAYGFCEGNDTFSLCWALLSRGDLMSITAVGGIPYQDESIGILLDLVPAAADLLVKA
ncbi:hypothetical protein ADK67_19455 [Saccharothrix sp. NRRL B-16348]|uniref:hypothetical protein n=1 Tax=Saccharothrix sp. NRRL B-16348 TaxID=1415542 RepID=UPI0006AF0123|nr:hypothetical protein [Saccharothrix sp. NRRL B-16348]KOX23954.1 hypothetical protein ADK67_19455 [Saccharothrix sp. NRRL B-16348]